MSGNKTGNKAPASLIPLVLPNRRARSRNFDDFCRKYVYIRGESGAVPMRPRRWQVQTVGKIFDCKTQPRTAALIMGRGNAKTTTSAAICLWQIFTGQFNANVCLVASDERQAYLAFEIARFMVSNSPELAARAQIYKDRILVPGTQSTLRVLPAAPDSLEGL